MNALKSKFGVKKYHQNLLGEALEDLLRKATAKTLEVPDEICNAQVVQAINENAVHSPKEIVSLLKKRLEMDNPQKQYLAVELMRKVLVECQIVTAHQEEVLQAVAGVMTRPGRNSPTATRAKTAARELLRSYGRTGYDAIRQVARNNFAGARPGAGQAYGVPVAAGHVPGAVPGAPGVPPTVERASLVDEVVRMVEAARGHTELLQDMLVNSNGGGAADFEKELMHELVSEVQELRTLFTPYLEQLGGLEGVEVEKAMCDALEAVDMLDNAIALQRDVAEELAHQPTSPVAAAAPVAAPAPAPSTSSPKATGPAAASPSQPRAPIQQDLIDLSDLGESLPPVTTTTAASPPAARDPFSDPFAAASSVSPVAHTALPVPSPTPSATSPAAATSSPVAQASTSPMANPLGPPPMRQQQPTNFAPFPNAMAPSNPMFAPQQQQYPMQMPMVAIPPGGMMNAPSSPTYSPTYSQPISPYAGGGHMLQPPPHQMYPMMPQMQMPPQQMPMYGSIPPQMVPQQMAYRAPGQPMGFPDSAFPQQGFGGNAFQHPAMQQQQQQPYAVHNPNNPFASMPGPHSPQTAAPIQTNVDKEWDMLFTDKGVPQTVAK